MSESSTVEISMVMDKKMNNYSSEFLNKLVLVFILVMALGLTGCGGGGGSDPAPTPTPDTTPTPTPTPDLTNISGGGIKGPLANAVVTIFSFDATQPGFKGAVATTASTDASSAITGLNLPLPLKPPYIMEFSSVPGTTTDITTGALPVITTIRTVITQALLTAGKDLYATPLTTLAVDIAVRNAADTNGTAGIQADEFEAALALAAIKVVSTFGFGLDRSVDIFDTPPLINSATISTAEQANVAGYRTAVEAITAIVYQISQQSAGATADTVLADLAADLADNDIIDGSTGSTLNANSLQVLQQNPSSLAISNTSPVQTVADVQAILAAETAITGSTTATAKLTDGTIVTQTIPAKTAADTDGDGVLNVDDAFPENATESVDTDGDGIGDNADPDDDNDGILDEDEGITPAPTVADSDGDGFDDGVDNCPTNFNPAQTNTDGDTEGDACDADDDNDFVDDTADAFPLDASESIDTDNDGFGDNVADDDDDNDGVLDVNDTGVSPLDGTTACAVLIDCDGDGVLDGADAGRTDPNVAINFAPITNKDTVTVSEDAVVFLIDVTANDIDDTVNLTAFGTNDTSLGTLAISGNSIQYTPIANANGTDAFSYTVTDGTLFSQGSVTVTIVAVNDSPVSADDAVTTDEDTVVVTGDVTANDFDVDGDALTAVLLTNASNGNVVDNGNGLFTYTPDPEFSGSDSFTYALSDNNGVVATAAIPGTTGTVHITVNPVNDNPVANVDAMVTNEDTGVTSIDVRLNDSDIDGDVLTIAAGNPAATNGTVVNNNNATFTYTPNANFNGADSFSYSLSDGNGGSATGTINITVTPVNDAPVANDDAVTTDEDTVVITGNVTLNDTDIDGDALSVVAGNPVAINGTVVNNNNGTFTYTPNANFNGSDSFVYTLSDGKGGSVIGTVNVTVNSVNNIPVANVDSVTTDEDVFVVTADVTLNDTDIDGDALTVVAGNPVAINGVVVNNNNGTFTYTPNANFNGSDSFSYNLIDGKGGSAIGTVNITVNPVNDNPVASTDSTATNEDVLVVTGNVTLNDTDIDDDVLMVVAGNPVATNGSVLNNDNGTFTYTPNANFNGSDSFSYTLSDGKGGSATGTVTITINPVNDNPVANADSITTNENTSVTTADVRSNDLDVDGDTLTAILLANASNGNVVDNNNGTFSYTPNANFNGSDSFSYTLSDGNGGGATGIVNITINPVNNAPVANTDTVITDEDTNVTSVDVRLNDTDSDNNLLTATLLTSTSNGSVVDNGNGTFTYTPGTNFNGTDSFTYTLSDGDSNTADAIGTVNITVNPVNDNPTANADSVTTDEDVFVITGDVTLNDTDIENDALSVVAGNPIATNGTVVNNNNGTFKYTPNTNFNGSDSFSYSLSDGKGGSATGTVSITVNPVNDNPVANADAMVTNEDTGATSIDVRLNDTDIEGDTLSVVAGDPVATNGTVVNNNNATFTYTPNANFNGADSFSYSLSDGNGGSATGTVNITVIPVNDAPVATDDAVTTDEDVVVTTGNVTLNDTDIDGDALSVVAGNPVALNGTVVNNNNGTFTYTPNANFKGNDSFTYTLSDGKGGSAIGTVNVTINSINDNPVANDDAVTTDEDISVTTADVRLNDTDTDNDPLTATLLVNASNGNVVDNNNGTFSYTSNANFNGSDSFTYTLSDGNGGSAIGTVNISINPVSDNPVAINDTVTTDEDVMVITGDVRLNDSDADGDTLTVTLLSNASNGNVVDNNDGTFSYTPGANFNGTDSFTYTLSDGNAGTATGTVNITVNSVNDLPVGNADSFTVDATTATVLDVLANDTDVDGTLTISNVSQGSSGSTVTHNGSTVTFTDINNATGSETFTYDVTDGTAIVTGINVTVNIIANIPNTPPVANDDNVTTTLDTTFFFNVLANDTDIDGDVLSVSQPTSITILTNGSLVNNGNGTFTYTPNSGFIGTDSFTYTVTDSIASAVGTVTITVTPPGTPIDIITLMSAAEGGVAGIENAETNVYAYWTDNYDPASAVFSPEDKVYNHLSGVFDTVVNNGDLLLSGTQWVSEGDIIGTDDGNGGLDLTILDANNVNVEVARFKLTAHYQDLSFLPIIDHLNTIWQGAMVNPNATFNVGAKLITDYRFEALVESHVLGQDSLCQRDGTTKFADLNGNCNSVDVVINATAYAQLLNDVVAATAWVDPGDFSTPPGAVSIATNNVTNKTLMVQLVSGGAANYYVVDWSSTNAFAFVANAAAGPDWVQNTDSGVDMIHFQIPASFITQFSDDLSAGLNYFLTVQNGFVRQGLKHAIGDAEFSEGQFNGNALDNILANFSAPVIPGLTELTGTWLSSVASANGDPALIHIFTNANYESSGSCDLDGSTGMEYGTVSADGSTASVVAIAQVATQGLCGPAQGNKTLAVNGDVLTLSEPGFTDIVYNRLLGTLNPIVGSWLFGNIQDPGETHTILTVLDDTTFALSQDCTADLVSGFEYGTYVWDQGNTNNLTGTLSIDSNGGCGLHDNAALSISGFTVTVVGDALTLANTVGGNFIFTRISPAYVIPMLQVVYTLDNLIMDQNNGQITGSFTWSYVEGDFVGGSGQFTDLFIPGYGTDFAALKITFNIEEAIQMSLAANTNNNGLDISLNLSQPLSLTLPSSIDTATSAYDIEINGRQVGLFIDGSITPQVAP